MYRTLQHFRSRALNSSLTVTGISGCGWRSLADDTRQPKSKSPISEAEIIYDFRRGNFERGVQRFCKRPAELRSNALHEILVIACAQVPDSTAAQAVLRAMPQPTPTAVAHVLNALCRELRLREAVEILECSTSWGVPLQSAMIATVSRAVHGRHAHLITDIEEIATKLKTVSDAFRGSPRPKSAPILSADNFFVDDWEDATCSLEEDDWYPKRDRSKLTFDEMRHIITFERRIRSAVGNVELISQTWNNLKSEPKLRRQPRLMAATVSALAASHRPGAELALDTLMDWISEQKSLLMKQGEASEVSAAKPGDQSSFVITSASKALGAATRWIPRRVLKAHDDLISANIPGLKEAIPVTDVYFRALTYANLSLDETMRRIESVREHHMQLDQRSFASIIVAALRSQAPSSDRISAMKQWLLVIRRAGVPLSIFTYNRLARQLRYCNDPELITVLLRDMSINGISPTPTTYATIFESFAAAPHWSQTGHDFQTADFVYRVIEAVENHMGACNVPHEPNSRLALAQACASLGRANLALSNFDEYLQLLPFCAESAEPAQMQRAFDRFLLRLAFSHNASEDTAKAVLEVFGKMRTHNIPPTSATLDVVLKVCSQIGEEKTAIQLIREVSKADQNIHLSGRGCEHLIFALTKVCTPAAWHSCKEILRRSSSNVNSPLGDAALRKLIVALERKGLMSICHEIATIFGRDTSDIDHSVDRNFAHMRDAFGPQASNAETLKFSSINKKSEGLRDAVEAVAAHSPIPVP